MEEMRIKNISRETSIKVKNSKAEGKKNFMIVPIRLRIKESLDMSYKEFSSILGRTRWLCQEAYNKTITDIAKAIYANKKIVFTDASERTSIESSEDIFNVYRAFYHEYGLDFVLPIKEGLRTKINSNLSDDIIKSIRGQKSKPPNAGTNFPIAYKTTAGFKLQKQFDGEYAINLPMQDLDEWVLIGGRKPTYQKVVLSTKTRRRRKKWVTNDTYDNMVRKTLEGEHAVQHMEIRRDKDNKQWMITLSARIPRVHRNFEEGKAVRVGVDMGIFQIFNVAFDDSPARLTLPYTAPSLIQFEIDASNRGFSIRRSKYAMRGGHGRKNKLEPLTEHTNRVGEQRKKIMELVVREAIDKIIKHVGSNRSFIVCLEKLGKLTENRPRCLHKANKNFPYKKLQDMLVRKAEEAGGKVEWVKSAYTSQRCSECGRINTYYNYAFRKDKKNKENGKDPLFRCEECSYGDGKVITGDYNASRNILTPNIDNLIKKQLKIQGIKVDEDEEEDTPTTYH